MRLRDKILSVIPEPGGFLLRAELHQAMRGHPPMQVSFEVHTLVREGKVEDLRRRDGPRDLYGYALTEEGLAYRKRRGFPRS